MRRQRNLFHSRPFIHIFLQKGDKLKTRKIRNGRKKWNDTSDLAMSETEKLEQLWRSLVTNDTKICCKNQHLVKKQNRTGVNNQIGPRAPKEKNKLKSTYMEHLLRIQGNNFNAAKIIQRVSRRCLSIQKINLLLRIHRPVKLIQTSLRRWLVRRWFQDFRAQKLKAICVLQGIVRGALARLQYGMRLQTAKAASICMQVVVRKYISKCFVKKKAYTLRRQRLYFGVLLQNIKRHIKVFSASRCIQSKFRQILANRRYAAIASKCVGAATHIQRVQRCWFAREKKKEMQFQQSMDQQRNRIRILKSKEEYWETCAIQLKRELRGDSYKNLLNKRNTLENDQCKLLSQINEEEAKYTELDLKLQELTPELIAQGWDVVLQENFVKCKNEIVSLKLRAADLEKDIENLKKPQHLLQSKLREAEQNRINSSRLREEEIGNLYKRQQQHVQNKKNKICAQQIRWEKEKWKIRFTTLSGKPDKKHYEASRICWRRLHGGKQVHTIPTIKKP